MTAVELVTPLRHHQAMTLRRTNPWRTLRARTTTTFRLDPIAAEAGGAFTATHAGQELIVIDPALHRTERAAALTHELVHLEHGLPVNPPDAPPAWDAVVHRDEARVDAETADRLVPPDDLDQWIRTRVVDNEPVTAADVATEWDTTPSIARRALRQAVSRAARRHPAG